MDIGGNSAGGALGNARQPQCPNRRIAMLTIASHPTARPSDVSSSTGGADRNFGSDRLVSES